MLDKKQDLQKTTYEKIPWYRKRWFWGVVLVITSATVYLFGGGLISAMHLNPSIKYTSWLFLIQFPFGLFLIAWGKGLSLYYKLTPLQSNIYLIIYYIIFLAFIFKTFYRKKVKIKYPLLLITIVIISLFGLFALYSVN
ncbi:MAG: hypothetical protein ABIG60_00635 [Patescibacteria group bacterium]